MDFVVIFTSVAVPILKLVCIVAAGYLIFRFKLLSGKIHSLMSRFVLYAALPSLLFSKLTMASDLLEKYPNWYVLPLSAFAIYLTGWTVGTFTCRLVEDKGRQRTICRLMTTFQNSGYLPLAIVGGIFQERADLSILVMIYVLGANPPLWTVCPAILSAGKKGGLNYKKMLNPPVVSLFCGFAAMLSELGGILESVDVFGVSLFNLTILPLSYIGKTAVPVILLVLGGTLAHLPTMKLQKPRFCYVMSAGKLLITPIIICSIVPFLGLNENVALIIMLASMMPPALNLTVQSKEFADEKTAELIGEGLSFSYIASAFTLTAFLMLIKVYMHHIGTA